MCYGSGCAFENWMGDCTVISYSSGIKEYFKMSPCRLGEALTDPGDEEYYKQNTNLLKEKRKEFYNKKDLIYMLSCFIEKNERLEYKLNNSIEWIIHNQLHKMICENVNKKVIEKCDKNCKTCVKQNLNLLKVNNNQFSTKTAVTSEDEFFKLNEGMTLSLPDKNGQMYFVW